MAPSQQPTLNAASSWPSDEKHAVDVSPVEPSYFPDDKICIMPELDPHGVSPVSTVSREAMSTSDSNRSFATTERKLMPYSNVPVEARRSQPRWWRRYMVFITIFVIVLVALIVGLVVGLVVTQKNKKSTSNSAAAVIGANNTVASVASSGVFSSDNSTFNMQTFWQNPNGSIQYMMSLDGKTFQSSRSVSLTVPPKIGSPITSTAVTDTTGLIYLSLFYMSNTKEITMCSLTCPAQSSACTTTANTVLKTTVPPHDDTGLTAVTVSGHQDWRVFYADSDQFLSQLEGDLTGFKSGEKIGGIIKNGSSMAAVNVNTTTNNINVIFICGQTDRLSFQQFAEGAWTVGAPVTVEDVPFWNPDSGIGAAYVPAQDTLRVYFTGLDTGIYEFIGTNASTESTTWLAQPGRNRVWAEADYPGADISAVGWNNQVRFFQQVGSDHRIIQASMSNTTWTQKFVV